ncbi:transposase [Streptomyces milbemycinicus]|uniref:transposase n=1 Tax=Streptomyces milbemycinicus TaxID=476552 RepID=UPI0033F281D2
MSLRPVPAPEIPEMTARVARAAFPKSCLAMWIRDELGVLFQDADFATAFPIRGEPGLAPGMMAVVSVMQFAERLADRQAADAVRSRINWKYLGMELEGEGFHFSVLSGFRTRLVEHSREQVVLAWLLTRLSGLGFLLAGGRVRTNATHVLALVRDVNRLESCAETLRYGLEALAVAWDELNRTLRNKVETGFHQYGTFVVPSETRKALVTEAITNSGALPYRDAVAQLHMLRTACQAKIHTMA